MAEEALADGALRKREKHSLSLHEKQLNDSANEWLEVASAFNRSELKRSTLSSAFWTTLRQFTASFSELAVKALSFDCDHARTVKNTRPKVYGHRYPTGRVNV